MHIRYVENTKAEVLAFKKMFERQSDVFVSACARIDDVGARRGAPPIDLLLIDVTRPDIVSVEEDVRTARKYTSAPIVFLTGDDSGPMRDRVLRLGAASVASKEAMSTEMIYRFVENAKAASTEPGSGEACARTPTGSTPVFPGWDNVLDYLARETDGASDRAEEAELVGRGDRRRILSFLRRLGRRDLQDSQECDAARLLADLREELIEAAAERGVPLLVDVAPPAQFYVIGAPVDARLGLEAIVLGLASLCRRGCRLRIKLAEEGDQTALTARTDGAFGVDLGAFFPEEPSGIPAGSLALAALQCGVALLGLRREQCDLSAVERGVVEILL